MKKIIPCPFCDGYAKIRKAENSYFVKCEKCGATSRRIYRNGGVSPAAVQNMVIDAWNRRHCVENG